MRGMLIIGSGKMAWDIGSFFLDNGLPVHWLASSLLRQAELRQKIALIRRRKERYVPEALNGFDADCHLAGDGDLPAFEVIIESTDESLAKKRAVLAALQPQPDNPPLLFSNSSSLLPSSLSPGCLGAHFFSPVRRTACIELIVPEGVAPKRLADSRRFFHENGIDIIEQDETNAFMANRLLLPLQAACLTALGEGFPAPVVEAASTSELIGIGQLSLMDGVGLDLIHTAVTHYRDRAAATERADCEVLLAFLQPLLALGKKGKKNGDGLLGGHPLLWPGRDISAAERDRLAARLRDTLHASCLQACRRRQVTPGELQLICERIFHGRGFSGMFPVERATGSRQPPSSSS